MPYLSSIRTQARSARFAFFLPQRHAQHLCQVHRLPSAALGNLFAAAETVRDDQGVGRQRAPLAAAFVHRRQATPHIFWQGNRSEGGQQHYLPAQAFGLFASVACSVPAPTYTCYHLPIMLTETNESVEDDARR